MEEGCLAGQVRVVTLQTTIPAPLLEDSQGGAGIVMHECYRCLSDNHRVSHRILTRVRRNSFS